MELLKSRPYYFLHTLIGTHSREFGRIMLAAGRSDFPELYKIESFLNSEDDTPQGVADYMGLDLREIMCTVSRPSPSVNYHRRYGLVLDGNVRVCYDNDSGAGLQEDGTYNDHMFEFTSETTPDELMGEWYDEYKKAVKFTWNEVVLEKGAEVIGVFYDPKKTLRFPESRTESRRTQQEEFELFLDKAERCGLPVLHIDAKF